ncbi:ferroxidase FET5 KNAG_0E03050 [Huiozyma naganishii CBS 8797]|uniref:Uncharacterized protein n=1 Tax=Huiozyma naganishii (strain ATCC MYA-139 / BCRC 22969 / CBS 8797 / KCTC 17520 / NBRC 10181 / NCYC 3082 / Yp74L-3) TaxID=1071383 RepID=J7S6T7_HUIN7|nr:hypothetical protein KNAG_0E03050 [Kazachstania naganishii CBS 8797]CCK70564.1 hypothetical protein KNAG_0E03050 [Kazachstania naganishii CBS 8797]
MFQLVLPLLLVLCRVCTAFTHTLHFDISWLNVTFAGDNGEEHIKEMIGVNGQWPLPEIHVEKGDRIELYLTNSLDDETPTSLHFHGLFHNTSLGNMNSMDGPAMVTQCPLVPGSTFFYNFTVPDQVGTYWYHAHYGAQYGDGFRGAFIIHDPDCPFEFDEDITITVSDLYYKNYLDTTKEFMSRYNPTGAEPIPQSLLFNDSFHGELNFQPGKKYMLRFVNTGLFVSQYITLEDHIFTIVEVDGTYVTPTTTNVLYISSGQRMAVLVEAKETATKNYALMQIIDETMLDAIPADLKLNVTNQVTYNKLLPVAESMFNRLEEFPFLNSLEENATNDFYLKPLESYPLYETYSRQVVFDVKMANLGDGINYAFFNDITYTSPKIPTLTTVLTSGKLASDPRIYSENINPFILQKNEIVEIVLNNYDTGRHPFHLHGHNFQIVQKSKAFNQDEEGILPQEQITVPYNESNPLMKFPARPMMRDTVVLEPNGHVVLRFKANNPGVWIFHCHVDWHLQQGLAAVFIEQPDILQTRETLNENYKEVCSAIGMPNEGNAAGHSDDWLNMDDLPRQPKSLPNGFTFKGYFAFVVSTLVGLAGLWTITRYGLSEVIPDDEKVYNSLKKLLDENNISY